MHIKDDIPDGSVLAEFPTLPHLAERKSIMVAISELHPFFNHPFRVNYDAELDALAESIRKNGVYEAIIIRSRKAGGYEIISGHRRSEAARIAGLQTIPAYFYQELDDDSATLIMLETNLQSRSRMLPSEKAKAYRMMRDVLYHKGNFAAQKKAHTNLQIAAHYGDSERQVDRFIRLSYLNRPLLDQLDAGTLKMGTAQEIAFLDTEVQCWITDYHEAHGCFPSIVQVKEMRRIYAAGTLTEEAFKALVQSRTPREKKTPDFIKSIREEYFPDLTDEDVCRKIRELVEEYKHRQTLELL